MMDTGDIIAALSLALLVLGGGITWVLRFGKVESAAEDALEAKKLAEQATKDLAEFKERVARDYATANMVAAVEGRVVAAIDRLGDRLDRLLEGRAAPAPTRRTTPKG